MLKGNRSNLVWITQLVLVYCLSLNANAGPILPQYADDMHLGVATCAGSTCHGAAQAFANSPVLQNEFITWQRKDKHSDAYTVLMNDESKRIARNLGLKSAHTAKICLDCHADNVAGDKRGKRFQVSDGVGCETCHGGAQRYLGLHVSGQATHQENIDSGLYPTENPVQRAKLCLSCHLGTDDKFATHRIMGAGHPRLSFELDTFTAIEPAHFRVDQDYRERKGNWQNVQVWAIGQVLATQQFLDQLASGKRNSQGLFPELAFFDCHACHHSMDNKRWGQRASVGLKPGSVRLNDGNLLMMREVARLVNGGLANSISKELKALHQASQQSQQKMQSQASKLLSLNKQLLGKLSAYNFSKSSVSTIINSIIKQGISGDFRDYSGAEQSVMAVDALLNTLKASGAVDYSSGSALSRAMDSLYATLDNEDAYQPQRYISGLKVLQQSL